MASTALCEHSTPACSCWGSKHWICTSSTGPSRSKGAYRDTWKAFVRLKQEGRVRFIGVSNFNVEHLTHIIDDTVVVPSVRPKVIFGTDRA